MVAFSAAAAVLAHTILVGNYNSTILSLSFTPPSPNHNGSSLLEQARTPTVPSPSWLEPHPTNKSIFLSTDESGVGQVVLYRVKDPKRGTVEVLDKKHSGGGSPAYVVLAKDGKTVIPANYDSGTVEYLTISEDLASLSRPLSTLKFNGSSVDADRQESSHPHEVVQYKDQNLFYVPDLGTDKVRQLTVKDGKLSEVHDNAVRPGSGPRHMAFSPDGKTAYLASELTNSLSVFKVSPKDGSLSLQSNQSILPPNAKPYPGLGLGAGELLISPDGSYVYVSNRNEDNVAGDAIAVFGIDNSTGAVKSGPEFYRSGGRHLRGVVMSGDKDAKYVVAGNMLTSSVVVFERDVVGGGLTKMASLQLEDGFQPSSFIWLN